MTANGGAGRLRGRLRGRITGEITTAQPLFPIFSLSLALLLGAGAATIAAASAYVSWALMSLCSRGLNVPWK